MEMYICPMHPEVRQEGPGRCPKCGMALVPENQPSHETEEKVTWKSYMPLIIVVGLVLITSLTISLKDFQFGTFSYTKLITYFMTGFFLTFAGFKLMDLKGFADGYSTYDLLAKKWFAYGYIYPFIELFFGLAMILSFYTSQVLYIELVIMTFSGIGVGIKMLKKEKFQCACLGTFLKVPLTKVTLIEDFGMAILAAILILIGT